MFEVYLERSELFVKANVDDENKKLQIFLTILADNAYVTLRSLLLPEAPKNAKFIGVVAALRKRFALERWGRGGGGYETLQISLAESSEW